MNNIEAITLASQKDSTNIFNRVSHLSFSVVSANNPTIRLYFVFAANCNYNLVHHNKQFILHLVSPMTFAPWLIQASPPLATWLCIFDNLVEHPSQLHEHGLGRLQKESDALKTNPASTELLDDSPIGSRGVQLWLRWSTQTRRRLELSYYQNRPVAFRACSFGPDSTSIDNPTIVLYLLGLDWILRHDYGISNGDFDRVSRIIIYQNISPI